MDWSLLLDFFLSINLQNYITHILTAESFDFHGAYDS
jgi:hypothetical protein